MKVIINFTIDEELLDAAIRNLLYFKEKVTKSSIINTIKYQIHSGGMQCVDFTEMWGSDIFEADLNEVIIEKLLFKYKSIIGM